MIVQHLRQHDIARPMATCKHLYYGFEPFLWRHVIIRHPRVVAAAAGTATVDLREFTITDHGSKTPHNAKQVFSIIKHSPRLVKLHINGRLTNEYFDDLIDLIANSLPQLRTFSLSYNSITHDNPLKLLYTCLQHPQLTDLECGFSVQCKMTEELLDSFICSSSCKQEKMDLAETLPSGSNIKSLRLPTTSYSASLLMRLLNDYCPNLERLHLPRVEMDSDKILDFSSQRWCINLQHIACSYRSGSLDNAFLTSILERSSKFVGIKTFHSGVFDDAIASVLDSLRINCSTTLTDVKIDCSSPVSYGDIHNLLKKCGVMQRFWIRFGDLNTDTTSGNWACLDLRELFLIFDPPFDVQGGDKATSILMANNAFEQIGRLSKLETLTLGWKGVECLCISNMKPEERSNKQRSIIEFNSLGGLQSLRHFHMTSNCWDNIGLAEIKFMHEQWPCWVEVSTKYRIILKDNPHWKWLKEQRPSMTY
ncbi:hypothetical protein BGZ49_005289, partial [Haplosporangium sp. Z 27]